MSDLENDGEFDDYLDDEDMLGDSDDDVLGELDEDDDEDDMVEVTIPFSAVGPWSPSVFGPQTMHIPETTSLAPEKLINQIQDDILFIKDSCCVTLGTAGAFLRVSQFDKSEVMNSWVHDREGLIAKAHASAGASEAFVSGADHESYANQESVTCPVCWDDVAPAEMYSLPCEHFLCKGCWCRTLHAAVNEGPSCLLTLCPKMEAAGRCNTVVTEEMFREVCNEEDIAKYEKFLIRSCVADNPRLKWCPAPDCEAATLIPDTLEVIRKIECTCGQDFCFSCQREWHDTCACKEVTEWALKEQDSEGGVALWLKANTKECPGCHKVIEKNQGCNHMTCSQCSYEFCWVCMGEWAPHGSNWYTCTRFDQAQVDAANAEISQAQDELARLEHYISRYTNNKNALRIMKEELTKVDQKMADYARVQKVYLPEAQFIKEVYEVLLDSYRVLMYSYIHAFNMPASGQKEIFEMLQADLEKETNDLAHEIEKPLIQIEQQPCLTKLANCLDRMTNIQAWIDPETEAEE